jgi:hypothetical protein
VTGNFTQNEYTLTTAVNPAGVGNDVDVSPEQSTYYYNDVVTLTADPGDNYAFDYWSGDKSGGTSPDTITMDGNKSVTGHFYYDCGQ